MRIIDGDKKTTIPRDKYYAEAIRSIIKAFEQEKAENDNVPEQNDVKQLWPNLQDAHKKFLYIIARKSPNRISQPILEDKLEVDSNDLRGIHNGLARICKNHEVENPVRSIGYNRSNRQYYVDASAAKTIRSLWKREQQ